ncbi:EboA domain-containing protein [Cecembia rubra]|uniref:EboA domain-containing protein n=1 Tax=Cecembia rubra TaxID=1485585 RepID=UPI002714F4CA|nr:EboA domain-containing protein [Cecembia rubra]
MSAHIVSQKAIDFLMELLSQQAASESIDWLKNQSQEISQSTKTMKLFLAFGKASKYFDKSSLQISEVLSRDAEKLRKGFTPSSWDKLQAARSILILSFPQQNEALWFKTINQLFETGDMQELKSLYAALPIYPFQDRLIDRAIEGLRTNMTLVFDAVALDNPYPSEFFDERAWNQMLIKSVFLQRPLFLIQHADKRSNENLASILIDYAHERWAAGRNVIPELWRYVAPFLNESRIEDIKKAIKGENLLEKQAGLLACHHSTYPNAKKLLAEFPDIQKEIEAGKITWESIGKSFAESLIKN